MRDCQAIEVGDDGGTVEISKSSAEVRNTQQVYNPQDVPKLRARRVDTSILEGAMAGKALRDGQVVGELRDGLHYSFFEGVAVNSQPLLHPPHQPVSFAAPARPAELAQHQHQLPV